MNAEILSVGTELLLGNIVNTDARDLSVMLGALGIDVYWHTVVGDNPERLRAALAVAAERADLILTTGGLGPTCDDLTKQTVAEFFGKKLCYDAEADRHLREFFRTLETPTENNFSQCLLPEGCVPFYNTCGTAPGCAFTANGKTVMILPGPPKEMNAMMRHGGLDYLRGVSGESLWSHTLRVFGLGESYVESLLRERMNALKNPTLAPYASEAEMHLRLTAKAATEAEAEIMMAPVLAEIRETLGDYLYGEDVPSLEFVVLEELKRRGETAAAAESCTGGLIAKRLTDLPGASAVFRGGVVVYTDEMKRRLLDVDAAVLAEKSAVSAEVAAQLAEHVREKLGTDYGIGVTGLAGPDGDGIHEVGTVFVSLAAAECTAVRALRLGGSADRSRVRMLSASHGLDLLRRSLFGLPLRCDWENETISQRRP